MKKHILLTILLLFTISIFASFLPVYASTSDFTYQLDANNNATITAYHGSETNVTIPNTIDGHTVKSIGVHAFDENRNTTNGKILTHISISEGITSIGDYAFIDCINLESITLPESLTSLGSFTFIGCSKLHEINIPSNLKRIEEFVFQDTGFTEFTIPEGVEYIGLAAFRSCKNLTSFKVYTDNVSYYDNTKENFYDPDTNSYISPEPKDTVFEYCSDNLVFYGNENSSTQTYTNLHKLQFKLLSEYTDGTPNPPVSDDKKPTQKPDNTISDDTKTSSIDNTLKNNATKDSTIANKILPKTGIGYCFLFLSISFVILSIIVYRKYNTFKF